MASPSAPATSDSRALAPAALVGGVGGLIFVASVVVQNAMRASAPAADASATKVAHYYATHRGSNAVLAMLFVVGFAGIATFGGALFSRLSSARDRGAFFAGALGLTGVIALFSTSLAGDLALSAYVHRGSPAPDVVSALWIVHNAVFGLLCVAIGVALAGLSAAAAAEGLIGAAWKPIGLVGAILLAIAAATTPQILDGSNIMTVGLVGFLAWLVFVAMTSVALLRSNRSAHAPA